MLSRIVSLFAPQNVDAPESHDERVRLATCVLLLDIAGADNEFSPAECEHIIGTLQRRFSLSQEDAEELLQAAEASHSRSTDIFKYTSMINKGCSNEEKMDILREVWRVIYTDGTLDSHEDHLVHRLGRLLNLTHPQLIEAKLAVLKEVRGQ